MIARNSDSLIHRNLKIWIWYHMPHICEANFLPTLPIVASRGRLPKNSLFLQVSLSSLLWVLIGQFLVQQAAISCHGGKVSKHFITLMWYHTNIPINWLRPGNIIGHGQHWLRWGLVSCLVPRHYLHQSCLIVNWTLRDEYQLMFWSKYEFFFYWNAFEYVICNMVFILFMPQCTYSISKACNWLPPEPMH